MLYLSAVCKINKIFAKLKYLYAFHATAMQVVHERKLNSPSLVNSQELKEIKCISYIKRNIQSTTSGQIIEQASLLTNDNTNEPKQINTSSKSMGIIYLIFYIISSSLFQFSNGLPGFLTKILYGVLSRDQAICPAYCNFHIMYFNNITANIQVKFIPYIFKHLSIIIIIVIISKTANFGPHTCLEDSATLI